MDLKRLALICVALGLGGSVGSPTARAEVQPAAQAQDTRPEQERQDAAIVEGVLAQTSREGPLAIQPHVAELRAVLERAPPSYPTVARQGDVVVLRTASPADLSPELLTAGMAAAAGDKKPTIRIDFNTYPTAAFLLGSFAVEARQPQLAIPFLEKGLAMQPGNPDLTSERANALYSLHRTQEGLAAVEAWLADHPLGDAKLRARMLRSKGFGLTELARLDEAEAAYQEALRLEPGHAGALHELDYIKGLRAGRKAAPIEPVTSDKAKSGAFDPAGPKKPS